MEEEAAAFRVEGFEYIKDNSIPTSRVWVMDETGLWTGSVAPRTYVNPATNDSGVLMLGDHRRDTGVVALCADGSIDWWFLEHIPQQPRKINGSVVITRPGVSGMGSAQMLQWSQEFTARHATGELGFKAVLILDGLQAHKNPASLRILAESGYKTFFMPPQAARLLSPCDNSFFSSMKARMKHMDLSTKEMKRAAFEEVCRTYPPDLIISYFRHCGYDCSASVE